MRMITRCPACSTLFKVVADQLKVSGGWVRCGHCSEVFDARAHLQQDAQASAPLPQARVGAEPAPDPVAAAPTPAQQEQEHEQEPAAHAEAPAEPAEPDATRGAPAAASVDAPEPAEFSFVRKARAEAWWRRPLVRAALALLCLVLLAGLALQVSYFERDRIAALEPQARPWLQLLCRPLDCELAPLRQLDALVIDSSTFNKLRTDVYRLNVVVRNAAPLELAMPALDLALTDTQDQPVLRRVLYPADIGAAPVLPASSEFSGTIVLQVDKTPVAGYRVLAFYP